LIDPNSLAVPSGLEVEKMIARIEEARRFRHHSVTCAAQNEVARNVAEGAALAAWLEKFSGI
jgi:hypothetical protein